MTTHQLIDQFCDNHQELIDYVCGLDDRGFLYGSDGKWTAGQQLSHVYLCLQPMSRALSSKDFIRSKFGVLDRPVLNYDQVIDNYRNGLANGGKAPEQFLPAVVTLEEKSELLKNLSDILNTIREQYEGYTDEELDTLVLPHPFLGKLSLREFFFLMTYHATHHLRQAVQNLAQRL
jgi:hypothetical protein